MLVLSYVLRATTLGRSIRAVAQDRIAAALLGVDIERTIAATFFIASALGGAAGMLTGMEYNSVSIDMGEPIELKGLAVIILGGMGSITGAVIGGFVIGAVETLAIAFGLSAWRDALTFGVMFVILIARPAGIFGARSAAQRITRCSRRSTRSTRSSSTRSGSTRCWRSRSRSRCKPASWPSPKLRFAGIAAYVSAIARMQYHWPLAAAHSCWRSRSPRSVAAVLAYPGAPSYAGSFSAIATIGFGEIVRVVVNNLIDHRRRRGLERDPERRRRRQRSTALSASWRWRCSRCRARSSRWRSR